MTGNLTLIELLRVEPHTLSHRLLVAMDRKQLTVLISLISVCLTSAVDYNDNKASSDGPGSACS